MEISIQNLLIDQIKEELTSSHVYLEYAVKCSLEGLQGCYEFFKRQSLEEREHAMRIVDYLTSEKIPFCIPFNLDTDVPCFKDILTTCENSLDQELHITECFTTIRNECIAKKDYKTLNFTDWFVTEQQEEESMFRTIIDKIKLIGDVPERLYLIDQEISKINVQLLQELTY